MDQRTVAKGYRLAAFTFKALGTAGSAAGRKICYGQEMRLKAERQQPFRLISKVARCLGAWLKPQGLALQAAESQIDAQLACQPMAQLLRPQTAPRAINGGL